MAHGFRVNAGDPLFLERLVVTHTGLMGLALRKCAGAEVQFISHIKDVEHK